MLGGGLVGRGMLDSSEVQELAGALAVVIGVVWSIWAKRK
jgi:hypothetical protein